MASHKRNMISTDLAADSSSLSFAGLLSVQDLQLKTLPTKRNVHFNHQEQVFEFSSIAPKDSSSTDSSKNRSVDDKSIGTGQLQLQALLYQTKQNQVAPKSARTTKKPANAHHTNGTKVADNSNGRGKSEGKKEQASSNLSFVQKLVSPCRECHAEKPSVKAHSIAEPVKVTLTGHSSSSH